MFQTYFKTIQQLFLSDQESSEHTYRTALEILLNAFKDHNINRKLFIKHEPIKQGSFGRPDYKISTSEQLTIGLIETKKIGENLNKILSSKQLENYNQLSDNIIVTDYLHFYLIRNGKPILDVSLFSEYNLNNKRFKPEQSRIDELSQLFQVFFESEPETIYKTKDLALKLADKAKFLKEYCFNELTKDGNRNIRLTALHTAFKETLLPSLDEQYFADIYAQTITYSLFLSALNCNDPKKELTRHTAYALLPNTFPLIKELFHSLDDFPTEIIWSIDEIITILKVTDFTAIKKEFAEYRHKERGFSDPFIFFYEDFLYHYDPQQRKIRGVYYTPEPVVSFIVRSIENILKDTFGLKDGFINKDVTLLDFATGTGTFILSAIVQAIEQAMKIADKETVNKILNEQIIKNFYGFEFLVAPYVIAHLKISEYLKEQGFTIDEGNRLNIFLTNTLTNKEPQPFGFLPHLSEEGKRANEIKNEPVLVILGNPPYAGHSSNNMTWVTDLVQDYYSINGVRIKEQNTKWLQDDYIKFIRFAQWKMKDVKKGIIGIITNNSYLDGLIHRGMRHSLMNDFNRIITIDLHGSNKRKEKNTDGSVDENVFDIMQGVAILFLIKDPLQKEKTIDSYDVFGKRIEKYNFLNANTINSLNFKRLNPTGEFYLFKEFDDNVFKAYQKYFKIKEIFAVSGNGIVTKRDNLVVDFNTSRLLKKIKRFSDQKFDDSFIANEFNLPLKDKDKWDLSFVRKKIAENKNLSEFISEINYRPFDIRKIFLNKDAVARLVSIVMQNYENDSNIGICIGRQWQAIGSSSYDIIIATNKQTDLNLFRRGGSYNFPLYVYNNGNSKGKSVVQEPTFDYGNTSKERKPNFTKEFIEFIKIKYKETFSPEQILGYIYAVLHSPTYRTKYIEFLKIDFPRVPFTDDEVLFKELSEIGFELIEHHLMKKSYKDNICKMHGTGDNYKVEKVEYTDAMEVYINKDRYFAPVPKEIWDFYIGGYQVLDKWLKERKKHEITLSGQDVVHFVNIVNILDFTIKTMHKIDDKTKDWI